MAGDPEVKLLLAVAKERQDNADARAKDASRERDELRRELRQLEAKVADIAHMLARIEGASGGLQKVAPWVAMAISAAFAVWGRLSP